MEIQSAIRAVAEHQDLAPEEMTEVMQAIMGGRATPAQIGGFLVALRMKGETVDEITAAARVMRKLATPVHVSGLQLVDTCGTGGDGQSTFNISTTSALVAAGAGAKVAKHGNRSVSSRSGSADVLEAAGVNLDLTPEQIARCIEEVGIGFLFAPSHHGAMKHAVGPRREMGIRTLFNLLGPLTNPAAAPSQVLGVFSKPWLQPLAEVLRQLDTKHALVVHAADGLDEISLGAETHVAELHGGRIKIYTVHPEQYGIAPAPTATLAVNSVAESLATMRAVLDNISGPARDVVAMNAGAAIYVSGQAHSLEDGIASAFDALASGAARQRLERLVALSNSL